jgi:hypothetical protein
MKIWNLQFTGPLSHYLNGEPSEDVQAWKSNVLHVHEKCIEWYDPGILCTSRSVSFNMSYHVKAVF